ncbi:MAG: hypothetical protein Q9187_003582 [Circinaria calcarea]
MASLLDRSGTGSPQVRPTRLSGRDRVTESDNSSVVWSRSWGVWTNYNGCSIPQTQDRARKVGNCHREADELPQIWWLVSILPVAYKERGDHRNRRTGNLPTAVKRLLESRRAPPQQLGVFYDVPVEEELSYKKGGGRL